MAVPPASLYQSSIWPTPRGGKAKIAMQATSSVTMATERLAERHRDHLGANDQAVLEARCMGQVQPCILDAYNKVPLLPRLTVIQRMTERSRVSVLLVDPESKANASPATACLSAAIVYGYGGQQPPSRQACRAAPALEASCSAERFGVSCMLRCRQKRLLGCLGTEGDGTQALECAAAAAKTGHCLHELRG